MLEHLTRGNGHAAVRVELQDHVMDALAVIEGARNGQLFIFRPAGNRVRTLAPCPSSGFLGRHGIHSAVCKPCDVGTQRLNVRQIRLSAIRFKQRCKQVGGAQGELGNSPGRCRVVKRQHVLELVCQFAELAVVAGSRVSFQRMDCAAQTARTFRIPGRFFQAQGFLVQPLDKLLRAFKEQLLEFAQAIVGGDAHTFTSRR